MEHDAQDRLGYGCWARPNAQSQEQHLHLRAGESLSAVAGLKDLILENRTATEKDAERRDVTVTALASRRCL